MEPTADAADWSALLALRDGAGATLPAGPLGALFGPVLGAIIIIALENKLGDVGSWLAQVTEIEWFNTLGESVTMVTGLIFVVCVLAFRRGIIGELAARMR